MTHAVHALLSTLLVKPSIMKRCEPFGGSSFSGVQGYSGKCLSDSRMMSCQTFYERGQERRCWKIGLAFVNSKGAKHIEYLVIPAFRHNIPEMHLLADRLNPELVSFFLPRLKAIISLANLLAHATRADAVCGGVVHPTSSYRYGSEDILQLAVTINVYDVGDLDVKKILAIGILVYLRHNLVQSGTLQNRDRQNYPDQMITEWRRMLKTGPLLKILMVPVMRDGDADAINNTIVHTFLDLAYWASRREGSVTFDLRSGVTVSNMLLEQITVLTRAVQAAFIRDPRMALANWEFTSVKLPFTPFVRAELDKVLAISRNTYLLASCQAHRL